MRNADRVSITSQVSAASYPRALGGFADNEREASSAGVSIQAMGDVFAINLSATYSSDASDGDTWRADHSYVSARWGNWGFGVGSTERFGARPGKTASSSRAMRGPPRPVFAALIAGCL